jgi:endonuclease/exonuclease/phosphatase (EEP) superfamily protein YafD
LAARRWHRHIEFALCLAGLLAGLAGLAAGRFADAQIELDIFNHFIPHLLIGSGACLLGIAMPRAKLATAIVATLIGVTGIGLWPHYVSRHGPPAIDAAEGERIVRVMAFNTRYESPEWRPVADEVLRQDPDIVALLEIGRSKLPALEALEAVYPHRAGCLDREPIVRSWCCRNSQLPPERHSRQPPYVRVTYGPELGELTVVAVHTTRPPFFDHQLEQMRTLGDSGRGGRRAHIVLGDFNATPPSHMLQTFIERSELELTSDLPTWPADIGLPQIAIDHIFVSPDLRVAGPPRIGSAAGSDHYPVIADIAIPAPSAHRLNSHKARLRTTLITIEVMTGM